MIPPTMGRKWYLSNPAQELRVVWDVLRVLNQMFKVRVRKETAKDQKASLKTYHCQYCTFASDYKQNAKRHMIDLHKERNLTMEDPLAELITKSKSETNTNTEERMDTDKGMKMNGNNEISIKHKIEANNTGDISVNKVVNSEGKIEGKQEMNASANANIQNKFFFLI